MPHLPTLTERLTRSGLWAIGILVLAFLVVPILVIIPLSFNPDPYFTYPIRGISLRWYTDFFASEAWRRAFVNSIVVGSSATFLATVLGTLAAFGLAAWNSRLKVLVLATLISPMVVPIIITAIGLYALYAQLGLNNSLLGIILAHTILASPFVLVTVSATLASFDRNLVRAGQSLGAGPFLVFRLVTLPVIMPGLVSGAVLAFATSFDEVVVVLFLAGPGQRTLPRQIWAGITQEISPTITAVATTMVLVSIALLTLTERLRRRSLHLRGLEA